MLELINYLNTTTSNNNSNNNKNNNIGWKTRPDIKQTRRKELAFPLIKPFHRVKIKGNEKRDKYLDFDRELKKLWDMKVTVIPMVNGANKKKKKKKKKKEDKWLNLTKR